MRTKKIKLSKSSLGEEESTAVLGVLEREYLGMGAEVQQFEQLLEKFFNRQVVCVVNGTAALHIALQSIGLEFGDEVLVQSITYLASFQAISAVGAKPVACDIDRQTMTINLADAEKRLTPRTKAIMPVHYSGGVGNLDEVYSFAEKNKLRVIEDAAHAFGTKFQSEIVGSFGDIACFSFDGIKNITSGEGGCIVTDDKKVLDIARDIRLLGVEKDTAKRYDLNRSWSFDVHLQGWRYHMSNIMAAIGIEQLKKFTKFKTKRQELAHAYSNKLENITEIDYIRHDYKDVVPHIFPIILPLGTDREKLRHELLGSGIETGIHYQPNHKLSLYRKHTEPLIVTDLLADRLLTLPLHPDMNIEDVNFVVSSLSDSLPRFY